MGDLGDLLELLLGGPGVQSMRATYDLWRDHERERHAFEAEMEALKSDALADVVSFGFAEDSDGEPEERASIELWFESPARLREERVPPGAREPTSYGVRDGDRWWHFDQDLGAVHGSDGDEGGSTGGVGGDFELVLNPAPLVGPLTLEAVGRGERAGRPVLRARARKRPDLNQVETMFHLRQLPLGADWYELEVDAERGVLLGLTAAHGAKPFWSLAAAEVEFDIAIAPEVFQFSPPAGVELKALEDLYPDTRELTLHEAAREAPFEVFAPAALPERWELEVEYTEGDPAGRHSPVVELWYTSPDASTDLVVRQAAHPVESEEAGSWQMLEEEGIAMRYRSKTEGDPQNELRLALGGTSITLLSGELGVQQLIKVAGSLRPAPREPLV